MTKLPIALAAALLAVGLASTAEAGMSVRLANAPSLVHKAGCYDECEDYYEAIQEAREEAREAAAEAAEEYAEEAEEYGYVRRSAKRRPRALPSARIAKPVDVEKAETSAKEETPKTSASKKDVAANAPANCKQYSPATGMLLSVPCE